jgi:hypothetical protein
VEHLHPDDLLEQTRNIFYCLKKGGIYVCVTPHRFSGPHDISKHFKALEASGLHLKEWTATELANLFRRAGFPQVQIWCGTRGFFFRPPEWIVAKVEDSLSLLNPRFRRRLVLGLPFRPFMNFRLVARKMG